MVTYWLNLFSPSTWQEFLAAGGEVTGFRANRWQTVKKIKPGDVLLCYVTQVSRFVGVLEAVSTPYQDENRDIWKDDDFPCRIKVRVIAKLTLDTAVPIMRLMDELPMFEGLSNSNAWTGHVRGSPTKWSPESGLIVANAVQSAMLNPVSEPIPERKLLRLPRAIATEIGTVTVPGLDETTAQQNGEQEEGDEAPKEPSAHTEIQWLLLKLGNDMGLDVWVARNDRSRVYQGQRFDSLPRLRSELPLQFDEATNRTIELIDVLWLNKNAFVSAFEIESTTSVYSGLLRMADLIAMQPNINIPLYLVAPDERRNKVLAEVNRPTFSRLSPPLKEVCRYLAFTAIRDEFPSEARLIRHLTPSFLEEFSEPCDIGDV